MIRKSSWLHLGMLCFGLGLGGVWALSADRPLGEADMEMLTRSLRTLAPGDRAALEEWLRGEERLTQRELQSLLSEVDSLQSEMNRLEAERLRLEGRLSGLSPTAEMVSEAGVQLYRERILPLFETHCFECHGRGKVRGDLDLTTRAGALEGGETGPSIIPGNAEASLLYRMTAHLEEPYMPYKGERLDVQPLEDLRKWIDLGAPYAEEATDATAAAAAGERELQVTDADRQFWSFRPLSDPTPPVVREADWVRNPIDAFILHRLEANEIRPGSEASRRTLIRRASFDLTGLPPTPDEVEDFLQDESPDAYERLIDRLLASPHYGERWGRHWLDLARYADSGGYEFDVERPTAYHYRDAVIEALNRDLPFNTFLQWQLAGDEYDPGNPLALALTGFCTSGPTISNQESEKNRYDELDDILATTSSAMLGLTVACARCHDHKYDAIPMKDYYSLLSIFTPSERREVFLTDLAESIRSTSLENEWTPPLQAARKDREAIHRPYREQIRSEKVAALPISATEKELLLSREDNENAEQRRLLQTFGQAIQPNWAEIEARLTETERSENDRLGEEIRGWEAKLATLPPKGLTLTDKGKEPGESYLLARGDPANKRGTIEPGFLSLLERGAGNSWDQKYRPLEKTTGRRRALAEWMVDVEDGAGALAARVIVNRLWRHHFGEGIVRTPSDFGIQGEPPTHPELLDWLAGELIRNGWSLKAMHKQMMLSATYRQAAEHQPAAAEKDPENRLWWKRRPMRLESEILRDAMLATAGNLNRMLSGPGIHPRLHPDLIATGSTPKWPIVAADGPSTWRRSVYIFVRRSVLMPLLSVFDGSDATQSCARRQTTVIPVQALELLNDRFSRQQAEGFAERLSHEAGDSPEARIDRAFHLALARPSTESEKAASLRFIEMQRTLHQTADPSAAGVEWVDFCQALMNLNEFIYID